MAFGRGNAVSIAFEGKDNVSPVVRGIKNSMDGFKKDAAQGFGLAAGVGVMRLGIGVIKGIGGALMDAQRAYSDLFEQQQKNNEVFKVNSVTVRLWAEGMADAFGVSERAALQMVTTLGSFLKGMGLSEFAAKDLSVEMVELATDVASFNNVAGGAEAVLLAITSALSGEAEPMKRFGVDVRVAAVNAQLLADGVEKVNGAFTNEQKIMGATQILRESLADTHGDVARNMNSSAQQARRYEAKVENLNGAIGGSINVFTNFAQAVGITAVDAIQGFGDALDNLDGSRDFAVYWDGVRASAEDAIAELVRAKKLTAEQGFEVAAITKVKIDNAQLQSEILTLREDVLREFSGSFQNQEGELVTVEIPSHVISYLFNADELNRMAEELNLPVADVLDRLQAGVVLESEAWLRNINPDDLISSSFNFFDDYVFPTIFAVDIARNAEIVAKVGAPFDVLGRDLALASAEGLESGAESVKVELEIATLELFTGVVEIFSEVAGDFDWGKIPENVQKAIDAKLGDSGSMVRDMFGNIFDDLLYERVEKGKNKGKIRNLLLRQTREEISTAKKNLRFLRDNPELTSKIQGMWADFDEWLYGSARGPDGAGPGKKGFIERSGVKLGKDGASKNQGLDVAVFLAGEKAGDNLGNWEIAGWDLGAALTGELGAAALASMSEEGFPDWLNQILVSEGVPAEFLATMKWTVEVGGELSTITQLLDAAGGTISVVHTANAPKNKDTEHTVGNPNRRRQKAAHGGSPGAGETYLIGERGPEFLTMGNRGATINPIASGGGSDIYLDGRLVGKLLDARLGGSYGGTRGRY